MVINIDKSKSKNKGKNKNKSDVNPDITSNVNPDINPDITTNIINPPQNVTEDLNEFKNTSANVNNTINKMDEDNNEDGSMKTRRRGRKPKDKFKYESGDMDEYDSNNKDDNIIIKLPLSCLKLNEEFNIGKDIFPYCPNITVPKPANPDDLTGHGISFSCIDGNIDNKINYEVILMDDDKTSSNIDNNYNLLNDKLLHTNDTNMNNNNDNKNTNSNNITGKNNNVHRINNDNCIDENNLSLLKDKKCNCDCKNKVGDTRQIDIILNNKYNSNTDKFNVLTHLGTNLNGNKWIDKTDIACLWCCHGFVNIPWGIPFKFANGKFQLFGNFCSPYCSLAYLLQSNKDDDSLWEKVALLNLLYFKVYGNYKSIMPALDKMALKMFGGTLEIDEYRNIISGNEKTYNIEFPPCNTIIPLLEEIYKKTNLNNTFIPVDKNRIQVANNDFKLKRSKPVVNHKNTIDFCLSGKSNL